MRFRSVFIEALAYDLPETCVLTADIESVLDALYARIGLAPGTLLGLTGVEARRLWPTDVRPWQRAVVAARGALDLARVGRDEVGLLVSTAVSRDVLEPSVASSVHGALGLPARCRNHDLANACLGFLSGMVEVGALIEAGLLDVGVVVAGEGSREVLEATLDTLCAPDADARAYSANLATLTLGSAAVAAVLVHERRTRGGHRLLGEVALAATEHNDLCRGDFRGMSTDGTRLLEAGVTLGAQTWAAAAPVFGWTTALDACAMHQVGRTHYGAITGALGIPAGRAPVIYDQLGNIGAAGVPVTLCRAAEQGLLRPGGRAALLGIGSGLNCAMQGVIW